MHTVSFHFSAALRCDFFLLVSFCFAFCCRYLNHKLYVNRMRHRYACVKLAKLRIKPQSSRHVHFKHFIYDKSISNNSFFSSQLYAKILITYTYVLDGTLIQYFKVCFFINWWFSDEKKASCQNRDWGLMMAKKKPNFFGIERFYAKDSGITPTTK